ncbi:hypothetical protein ABZT17_40860 [Streptomyces sp. NPDC005648]|uniref:hypothetical protein n=1 Tax=Streptomyces sp. NPDC005648 TaxID=3157044 RepID=UPI0033B94117
MRRRSRSVECAHDGPRTLRPEARARINTAYRTCAFLGGSAGSWLGVRAHSAFGWNGVCGLVVLLAGLAPLRHVLRSREAAAAADARVPAPAGNDGVSAGR